jgi:hypothetical protein
MSGPKCAYVRRTPISRVAAAQANVERAMSRCASPEAAGLPHVIAEAERWLSSLRRETARWGKQSGGETSTAPSPSTVQKLERLREDLSLCIASEQRKCDSLAQAWAAAHAAVESAQRILGNPRSTAAQLAEAETELSKAAQALDGARRLADQAARRIERLRAEFEAYYNHAVSKQPGPRTAKHQASNGGQIAAADAAARAAAAAAAKLSEQLDEVSRPPQSGWAELGKWSGMERSCDELKGLLQSAGQLLAQGDLTATEARIEQARLYREELEQVADTNRGAAERLRCVADAVMQALCDRHYDTPVFGAIREGDPLSGIQIRADVPSSDGRGNIRIDLHADGRADFEVENVPVGEEETCRAVIEGLAEAVASEGMELEVTDWGRAAAEPVKQAQTLRKTERERERMRPSPEPRSDAHGGRA